MSDAQLIALLMEHARPSDPVDEAPISRLQLMRQAWCRWREAAAIPVAPVLHP